MSLKVAGKSMQASWHENFDVHLLQRNKDGRAFLTKKHAFKVSYTYRMVVWPICLDCPFRWPCNPIYTSTFYSSVLNILYEPTGGSPCRNTEELQTVAVGWKTYDRHLCLTLTLMNERCTATVQYSTAVYSCSHIATVLQYTADDRLQLAQHWR